MDVTDHWDRATRGRAFAQLMLLLVATILFDRGTWLWVLPLTTIIWIEVRR